MAFGISAAMAKLAEKLTHRRIAPVIHAPCPDCGMSSKRFHKIKRGNYRAIVCGRKGCKHVSQEWYVGRHVPTPKGA